MSQPRVASILNELVAAGLADRKSAGLASLFTLNRKHLAACAVEALASIRSRLWARIAAHAKQWAHRPEAIVVFGSTARGDGDTSSDIDLPLVRPADVSDDDQEWNRNLTERRVPRLALDGQPVRAARSFRRAAAVHGGSW